MHTYYMKPYILNVHGTKMIKSCIFESIDASPIFVSFQASNERHDHH